MTWAQLSFYRLSDHFLPCWRSIDATNQSSLIIFEDSCQGFRASCLAMVVYGPLYWNQARGLSEITVKKKKENRNKHLQVRVSFLCQISLSQGNNNNKNLCGYRTRVRQRSSSVSLAAPLRGSLLKNEWKSSWIRPGSAQVNISPPAGALDAMKCCRALALH